MKTFRLILSSTVPTFLFFILCDILKLGLSDNEKPEGLTSVILVGATSNLAKKYLWQSIFNSFARNLFQSEVIIIGGATRQHDEGEKLLGEILPSSISCIGLQTLLTTQECEEKRNDFFLRTHYQQLKYDENYADLDRLISAEIHHRSTFEIGRLFYLSISPDFYQRAAQSIHLYGRPKSPGLEKHNPWLRVVLEKPFGRDLKSASDLSKSLEDYLSEIEMYRVDHYLGKLAVLSIKQLRMLDANGILKQHLQAASLHSVKVIMKEQENCDGRTGFFDKYGTIRDVHQNHLTQILLQLTMNTEETGGDQEDEVKRRLEALQKLDLFGRSSISSAYSINRTTDALIFRGQYEDYNEHVRTGRYVPENFSSSDTETSAGIVVEILTDQWMGVPIVLFAGKALNERETYVEVEFEPKVCSLVWGIQGGIYGTSISYQEDCPFSHELSPPAGWEIQGLSNGRIWMRPRPEISVFNAYDVVVENVVLGKQAMFMTTQELLMQWAFWDKVLQISRQKNIVKYHQGSDGYYFEDVTMDIKKSCFG